MMEDVIRLLTGVRDIGWGEGLEHFLLKIYGLLFLRSRGYTMMMFEPEIFGLRPDILAVRILGNSVEIAWVECGGMHKSYGEVKIVLDRLKHLLKRKLDVSYRIFNISTRGGNLPEYVDGIRVSDYVMKLLRDIYSICSSESSFITSEEEI